MSFNTGNNPNIAKTAIDELFFEADDRTAQPNEVLATSPTFFKDGSGSVNGGAVITEVNQGPGLFKEHTEEQVEREETIRSGNKQTHYIKTYRDSMYISEEFNEDDLHSSVEKNIRSMGKMARYSRDYHAFDQSYGDAFSGITTDDDVAMISNSHTAMDGSTVDNLETGTLSPDNLDTLIRSLKLQDGHNGRKNSQLVTGLLFPPALFKEAVEITQSEQAAQTGDNDINFFSLIYPGVRVGTSIFLDSSEADNTNANTSYFAVSDNHSVTRWVKRDLKTDLVEPKYDNQNRWKYKASFRELVGPITWVGIAGSNGTV